MNINLQGSMKRQELLSSAGFNVDRENFNTEFQAEMEQKS